LFDLYLFLPLLSNAQTPHLRHGEIRHGQGGTPASGRRTSLVKGRSEALDNHIYFSFSKGRASALPRSSYSIFIFFVSNLPLTFVIHDFTDLRYKEIRPAISLQLGNLLG
jgi:hypothetical protein